MKRNSKTIIMVKLNVIQEQLPFDKIASYYTIILYVLSLCRRWQTSNFVE